MQKGVRVAVVVVLEAVVGTNIKLNLFYCILALNTMSKPRSPVTLYSHLSAKLREFGELLPTAFQQRSDKAPFPVLELIEKLHDIVWHEQLAPDYDEKTKKQLREIRWDLRRMVNATETAVEISRAGNLMAFHTTIYEYDTYLYKAAHTLIDYIRMHLDPLIDAMFLEEEKAHGKPVAICIQPYRPWDAPPLRVELWNTASRLECEVHRCANPKEPWPKCCREASAAFSKDMEQRHFRAKLNL
jgi:hypothetical protein